MGAIIADFGKDKQGINLYRINGSKLEIENAIDSLKEFGCEVWQPYEFDKAYTSWSVLLKVQIPELPPIGAENEII